MTRVIRWVGICSPADWCLRALLLAAFALGGSARGDVAPLMLLRPLAVGMLGYGLTGLKWSHLKTHRFLFGMATAMVGWLALQLVPLPPALWQALPGRDLIVAIDQATGTGTIWRPLSMVPDGTHNALFALLIPLGVLVLGAQLNNRELRRLLPLIISLAIGSAIIGLVQTLGDPSVVRDPYRLANSGFAVGLFANRNHQALLLATLFPMLALSAHLTERPALKWLAVLTGLPVLPLILVTGSRSGVICALLALSSLPLIRMERGRHPELAPYGSGGPGIGGQRALIAAGIVAAAALIALTIGLGRGTASDRLFATTPGDELRLVIIPILLSLIVAYLPTGTGAGSFPQIYQINEPDRLLSTRYVNHAHNDWLEVLMTDGLPAALLLLLGVAAFLVAASRAWRYGQAFTPRIGCARVGLIIVLLSAVASMGDYPLRTPALACLFVVATLWAASARPSPDATSQSS